ncbi:zinc metalloproteinase/disintegrin-like [Watersipora subatra]|uniref:zinc metalloproteinase/disintegrin-like n=1 Tax=Watersipora subatra TaxID=2589382 RepID=UPI00355C14E0
MVGGGREWWGKGGDGGWREGMVAGGREWWVEGGMVGGGDEYLISHSGLPAYSETHPHIFAIEIGWVEDEGVTNLTMSLVQSEAVGRMIPLYATDNDGRPVQTRLANLKHTAYYHDLSIQASISLTSFSGERYIMAGSFLRGENMYNIMPYNPKTHKRSLGAATGDHVIERQKTDSPPKPTDYMFPNENTPEYLRLMRSWAKVKRVIPSKDKEKLRRRRSLQENSIYTVQLYMLVDVYAYNMLVDQASFVDWPNDEDDFIAFYMGHQANESTIQMPYSAHSPEQQNGRLSASRSLQILNEWVNDNPAILSKADHVMLVTSLDIHFDDSLETTGIAWVGGICGKYRTSIVELNNTATYAHELGHNLGAAHDGNDNSCSGNDDFVMAATGEITNINTRGNPWYFSDCSVEYFDAYLNELGSEPNCLEDNEELVDLSAINSASYLGQIFSVDEQCLLLYGEGYMFYGYVCTAFRRYVPEISSCSVIGVSCGSMVINSTIAIPVEDEGVNAADASPTSQRELYKQISMIGKNIQLGGFISDPRVGGR